MKLFFLLLSLVACASAIAAEPLDIVFDIDWTLVQPLDKEPAVKNARTLKIADSWYHLDDSVEEVLSEARRMKNTRISFFSGGDPSRNMELLKQIKLENGKTAHDIAYKILSKDDLTRVSTDATLKFSERFRKDLTKVSKDLTRIVLVDDNKSFALPGQEKNMLWLGKTYNYIHNYDEWQQTKPTLSPYDPPNKAAWLDGKQKLKKAWEKIKNAETQSHETPSTFLDKLVVIDCHSAFSQISH